MSIRATPCKAYLETFDWEQKARTNPLFGVMSVEDFGSPHRLRRYTFVLEGRSLIYGWVRRAGIPVPVLRLHEHDHWSGARPGYGQLISRLRKCGLRVHLIEYMIDAPHLVRLHAHKPADPVSAVARRH